MIEVNKIWERLKSIGVERAGSFSLVYSSGRSQEKLFLLMQNMLNESIALKQTYNDAQKSSDAEQWDEVNRIVKKMNQGPGWFGFIHGLKVQGWKSRLKTLEKEWVRDIEHSKVWMQAFVAMAHCMNQMNQNALVWLANEHDPELASKVSEGVGQLQLEILVLEKIAKTLTGLVQVKQERLAVLRQALGQMETVKAILK